MAIWSRLPVHVAENFELATRKALAQQLSQHSGKLGFSRQRQAEVVATSGLDPKIHARPLLETLVKSGKLIRVSNDLIFHADVIAHIRQSLAAHKGRQFTVTDFKSWTNISRKYAIPLLEYLDHQHVTKRDGDVRVVL